MLYSRTVIVTGASRGIGKSIAELFANKGYKVLINFNHSEKKLYIYIINLGTKDYR